MPIISNSLFHYTNGGFPAIKGILENGFRVKCNKELHVSIIARGLGTDQDAHKYSELIATGFQDIDFIFNVSTWDQAIIGAAV